MTRRDGGAGPDDLPARYQRRQGRAATLMLGGGGGVLILCGVFASMGATGTGPWDIFAALFAADRLHHIYGSEDGILARLDAGESVLCDRFYFSSLAYNGGMAESEWVKQLNTPAMNACVPDLVVFIDLTPEDAMARILRRGKTDRYESVGLLEKIRTGYLKAFENVPSEKLAFIKSEQEK